MAKKPFSSEWAQHLLQERLQGVGGRVGVMVTDLATGQSAAVNPDFAFPAASVVKVPIAMAVLHLVTTGAISLDDMVTYQSATDYEGGAGSLRYTIKEGDQFPIRYLLDRMIVVSDNIARNMLERYIGSGAVRDYMLSLGVQPPYDANSPIMTARGADLLLTALDAGRANIRRDLTQFLIGLMIASVHKDRIPAKLPPGVTVANKVGTLDNDVHDVGLVYAPDRSFAISAFTEGIPYEQATNLIADMAASIYWYEDWLARNDR